MKSATITSESDRNYLLLKLYKDGSEVNLDYEIRLSYDPLNGKAWFNSFDGFNKNGKLEYFSSHKTCPSDIFIDPLSLYISLLLSIELPQKDDQPLKPFVNFPYLEHWPLTYRNTIDPNKLFTKDVYRQVDAKNKAMCEKLTTDLLK